MPNEITFNSGDASSAPLDDIVPVTLASTVLPNGVCRCIVAETAGRVNLTMQDGTTVRPNVPLVAGYNPIVAWAIAAPTAGTAATGIFAGY
jgi:hypothetical protein